MESGARRSLPAPGDGGVAFVRRDALARPSHCSHGAGFFFSTERR